MHWEYAKVLPLFVSIENAVLQSDGGMLCQLSCEEGSVQMELFPVLPGVFFLDYKMDTHSCSSMKPVDCPWVEISYCSSGRMECRMQDGCCLYMGEGEVFLSRVRNHSQRMDFPLGHYRGLSILVDEEELMDHLPVALQEAGVSLPKLFQRLFAEDDCCLIHRGEEVERVFSGLSSAPPLARQAYLQLKAQEFLLYLSFWEGIGGKKQRAFPPEQVEIAKRVQQRLTQDLREPITIEQLAQEFNISATALKSCFKGVYGMPIAAYRKDWRMRRAALLLEKEGMTVAQAAHMVGYENQSKFAAAFKESMGDSPLEYRRKSKEEIPRG